MIELQLEKAGVRLAYLLDANLRLNPAGQNAKSKAQTAVNRFEAVATDSRYQCQVPRRILLFLRFQ